MCLLLFLRENLINYCYVHNIVFYFSGATLPDDVPSHFAEKKQYYHDGDSCDEKLSISDMYEKNTVFFKYKEEFKQQINFTGTLYR